MSTSIPKLVLEPADSIETPQLEELPKSTSSDCLSVPLSSHPPSSAKPRAPLSRRKTFYTLLSAATAKLPDNASLNDIVSKLTGTGRLCKVAVDTLTDHSRNRELPDDLRRRCDEAESSKEKLRAWASSQMESRRPYSTDVPSEAAATDNKEGVELSTQYSQQVYHLAKECLDKWPYGVKHLVHDNDTTRLCKEHIQLSTDP